MNRILKFSILLLLSFNLKAQIPTAIIITPTIAPCTGVALTFTTSTTNTPTAFSWSVLPSNSVAIVPDKTNPFITLTFAKGGVYTLSLQVSNATGTTSSFKTFTVIQNALASFNASFTNVGFPTTLNLTNYSTNGINNVWSYNDVPTTDVSYSAIKNYTASGSYSVTLIEYGSLGCNDTSVYAFRLSDSSGVTIPNIFTPNNDSINDIFRPIARGIEKMNVWIYSRYGTFIYSWDKPHGFWDGYTSSGEPCAAGIYFCVLEATGFDGKSYKLKGSVTLVK